MRHRRTRRVALALALVLSVFLGSGCGRAEPPTGREATFAELYPMEMNVRLLIEGPPLSNMENACGKLVVGTILNQSSDPILLPAGNRPDLWTYSWQEGTWVRVEDQLVRSSEQSRVVKPKGSDVPFWPLTYLPAVDCSVPSRIIRVVVVGTVLNGDKPASEQTGAFIDIFVDPVTGEWKRADVLPGDPEA